MTPGGPVRALALGCLVACVASAVALAGSPPSKPRPQTGNGVEPFGSAAWPAVAAKLAQGVARDSFARDYGQVWTYLDPAYRQAVSHARWQACQRSHPSAPPGVTITRVEVAQATQLPIDLSLLGRQEVQEIELYVQYTTPALRGPQVAIVFTFWLKRGAAWSAVWPSGEYDAYKTGRCYVTPGGSPLY